MMISWGELQGYHSVWIGIIEAGEEQNLFGDGSLSDFTPHLIKFPWYHWIYVCCI